MERVRKSSKIAPLDCKYVDLAEKSLEDGKVQRFTRLVTVEPIILGTSFCVTCSNAVITNLITRQACYDLGAPTMTDCQRNATLENESQKITADIQAINVALASIVPIFACIFIGPWSDANGRKPFLNLTISGHFLHFLLYAVLSSVRDLNPMWLITPSIILMFTGGPPAFIMLTFCCLSDNSSEHNKTFRMGLGVTSALVASGIGPLAGNWLYGDGSHQGFIRVFVMISVVSALTGLYSCCILPETVVTDRKTEREIDERFIPWTHYLGVLRFFNKKRPGRQMLVIILILFVVINCTVFTAGESEVLFLSLKKQFRWDIDEFSKFTVFTQALSCFYTTFGIWLLCSYLKVSDFATLSGTLFVYLVAMIVFAIARTSTWVVAANGIGACGRMAMPMYKSMIAKAVDVKEIGTALTVTQICESLFGSIFTAVYAKIYGALVSHSPLAIYYVSAFFAGLGFLTLQVVQYVVQKDSSQQRTQE